MNDRSDVEVDPVLDRHLRHTLREIAATIDAGDDRSGAVVRLIPRPPEPPRSARPWFLGAVAAVAVLGTGAGLVVIVDRGDGETTSAPSSLPVIAVVGDVLPLAEECHSQVEGWYTEMGADIEQPPPPDPTEAMSLLFDTSSEPPDQTLIIVGDSAFYLCNVSTSAGEPSVANDDPNVFTLPAVLPNSGSDVQVVDRTSLTGVDPFHGPGWVRVIGRVGPDVTSVELELPDGSVTPGEIQEGWFVLEASLGAGVPDMQERVNWTTADGSRHSSRSDLLDPPDETEACAANPDCVTSEIDAMLREAQGQGFDDQAEILADLVVTDDELYAAQQRFAECVNATDFDITITVHEDGSMEFTGEDLNGDSPDWDDQNNVQLICAAAHLDLVDRARSLLRAQERVEEG